MAPTPSAEPSGLPEPERATLLRVARESIIRGLQAGEPLRVRVADHPAALRAVRASFVTLHGGDDLRGCIGHLEAVQPLVEDVAENAYAAAFRDPRFPPLRPEELGSLRIHVSVLTPPEPLPCASEAELLTRLRPGRDGLILEAGHRRGTFLPSVWASLPGPREFLHHLKLKAGLPGNGWPAQIRVYRYETESFGERT